MTANIFNEMRAITFKNWPGEGMSLIQSNRFTAAGLKTYWQAINDAFEGWDKDQMKHFHANAEITG